jgi:hypothetical protein
MLEAEVGRISNWYICFGSTVLSLSEWSRVTLALDDYSLLLDVIEVFADAHRGEWTELFKGYFLMVVLKATSYFVIGEVTTLELLVNLLDETFWIKFTAL